MSSAKVRKMIYKIDPNAEIRNSVSSIQSQSFDVISNPSTTWSWMINPYNASAATLTNDAVFIFYYSVKVAAGKSIRFANNIVANGINTMTFSQGEQSVFTMTSANTGRSFPLWITYNRLVDWKQEGIYQCSQAQDSTFFSNTLLLDASDGFGVPANEMLSASVPFSYNTGRQYIAPSAETDHVFTDTVVVPLKYIAPTAEPLSLAKGVLQFNLNWTFSPEGYLH